jgi:Na+(H+)/acetate symporter ActP
MTMRAITIVQIIRRVLLMVGTLKRVLLMIVVSGILETSCATLIARMMLFFCQFEF